MTEYFALCTERNNRVILTLKVESLATLPYQHWAWNSHEIVTQPITLSGHIDVVLEIVRIFWVSRRTWTYLNAVSQRTQIAGHYDYTLTYSEIVRKWIYLSENGWEIQLPHQQYIIGSHFQEHRTFSLAKLAAFKLLSIKGFFPFRNWSSFRH